VSKPTQKQGELCKFRLTIASFLPIFLSTGSLQMLTSKCLKKGLVSPSVRVVNSLTTCRGYAKSGGLKIGWARW
jgi:hypothetical protein